MAGAIGLTGIHNVSGVCDLCGVKCDPDSEDLNALDCTYKDCPPMVYHQDCLEKYLKSIRLEKNRKTGFKCPRGCGKGSRFKENCRGKIDKSHPIHVRHDAKSEKKEADRSSKPQKQKHAGENRVKNGAKKKPNSKATLNVHDLNLVKLVPAKSERQDSEWCVKLKRSKSMEKSSSSSHSCTKKSARTKGQRLLTGSFSFNTSSRMGTIKHQHSKSEVSSEIGSGDSAESVPSQGDGHGGDVDQSSSDTASVHQASGRESPENGRHNNLPSLQEEALRHAAAACEEMHTKCRQCLIQWKTAMLVQQLYRMGFELWQARSAVHIFGSNMEEAIQWLVENGDIRESQLSAFLQHHPVAEICIEFELRSMAHACQHNQIDEALLEKTIIQFGGDLTSAINSLIGDKANVFPDCDLSLGIVHSETPFLSEDMTHRALSPRRSVDTLSDEMRLGCVLGSALDEYKRGQADFTDLASKDLGYYCDSNNRYASSGSLNNSPLSHHSMCVGSPSALLQDQGTSTSFWGMHSQLQHRGLQLGNEEAASSTTLRHFIGNILE